MLGQLMILHV